jgi:hypothetical protein
MRGDRSQCGRGCNRAGSRACSRAALARAHALGAVAQLVFDIDIEYCRDCGGSLNIIAAIEDAPVIVRILAYLGLPTRAPPRSPACRVDLFQAV